MKEAKRFRYPVLFFHGDEDVLTQATNTQEFFQKCNSSDKTFKLIQGAHHELANELNRYEYFNMIYEWMVPRMTEEVGSIGNLKIGDPGLPQPSRYGKYVVGIILLASIGLFIRHKLQRNK